MKFWELFILIAALVLMLASPEVGMQWYNYVGWALLGFALRRVSDKIKKLEREIAIIQRDYILRYGYAQTD